MVAPSPDQQHALDTIEAWIQRRGPHRDHVLGGPAGTGKTTVLREVLNQADDGKTPITLTASTNKAASVLSATTGREATTVHSALGIRHQEDAATGRESFRQVGPCAVPEDSLLVIDEASMINRDLMTLIGAEADRRGCGCLFVGDPYQLPPVGEPSCPVFADVANQSILTTVHRQGDGNPLIDVATEYRQVLDGEPFPPEFRDVTSEAGGCRAADTTEWLGNLLDAFDAAPFNDNPDRCRALAWTNRRVNDLNRLIRRRVVGADDDERFVAGEMVAAGSPITKRAQVSIDGEMTWIDEVVLPTDRGATVTQTRRDIDDYGVRGWRLDLGETVRNIFVPDNWADAKRVLSDLSTKARRLTEDAKGSGDKQLDRMRRDAWREFFTAKKHFADIRYPYASTVHKSQGSTYDIAFIDVGDIGRNRKRHEVARLSYVSLTRPVSWAVTCGQLPERVKKGGVTA